jgi:energy-coupling factor transporter ATP-binding protein EcfA2
VLQDSFLFEGTIAANIVYGNPDAAPEKIIAAAKAASAHEFIMRQPFGYETLLGERGSGLSGGERQRLSIARAILYEPQVLILDEATSSVDTESERMIQEAVERFSRGRTTLTIAHRLSTLKNADQLIVLDRGRLVEKGTHDQLLNNGGLYARLVRMQHGKEAAQRAKAELHSAAPAAPLAEAVEDAPSGATAPKPGESTARERAAELALGADPTAPSPWLTRWLDPAEMRVTAGEHGVLTIELPSGTLFGVSATRAFPATHSDEYLSVRHVDVHNRDYEVGMIRSLNEWPVEAQELIRRSLNRRYLLRVLTGIKSVWRSKGVLSCVATTDAGEIMFVLSGGPESIKKFGPRGRLLLDVDNNHYLIPDMSLLPAARRRKLQMQFADF